MESFLKTPSPHPTPTPCLEVAFTLLTSLWGLVETSKALKEQWTVLTSFITDLVDALDENCKAGRIEQEDATRLSEKLEVLLRGILDYKEAESAHGFLKSLYFRDDDIQAIEQFHREAEACVSALKTNVVSVNVPQWQDEHEKARQRDQDELNMKLGVLESNRNQLGKVLDDQHSSMMAMMVSLQKSINKPASSSNSREKQFYSHSLNYLSTMSGERVQLANWMITSFEVEFREKIGSGGFGQVFKGVWNKIPVAIKVFRAESGAVPRSASIKREIDAWMNLRHPHILQFLGANIFDDQPFIVMPLMKNGNSRDYIAQNPNCDRLKILHHACLGLVHLHSQNVIHGDLKGVNILIDDAGDALLCDFGLSRIKADASAQSTQVAPGSRHWMSPERILGGGLKKPVDIYAFGMTIYELYAEERPLGHIEAKDLIHLVVDMNVRPERPDKVDAPELSDELWDLARRCWAKSPEERPTASIVCDNLMQCMNKKSQTTLLSTTPTASTPSTTRIKAPAPAGRSPGRTAVLPLHPKSTVRAATAAVLPPPSGDKGRPSNLPEASEDPSVNHSRSHGLSSSPRSRKLQRAEVLQSRAPVDSCELSITKGERLEIIDQTGQWWIARKPDGTEGVIPSTFVRMLGSRSNPPVPGPAKSHVREDVAHRHPDPEMSSRRARHERYQCNTIQYAEVIHSYSAGAKHEISVTKGELIEILHQDGMWWIVRKVDDTGAIPSTCAKLLGSPPDSTVPPVLKNRATKDTAHAGAAVVSRPVRLQHRDAVQHTEVIQHRVKPGRGASVKLVQARNPYTAQQPHELSFERGEILRVLDSREQWWIARNQAGKEGRKCFFGFLLLGDSCTYILVVVIPWNYMKPYTAPTVPR
ncbi:kinase-like protein [Pluteus cervinus]|uniref:Kinase-like protein n=1 Tax=Pluteus cervinus TaxID=181527 RepID=A0ACD3B7W4_9AGAR|nr:kinase-like protein [Pluteus cervinus]